MRMSVLRLLLLGISMVVVVTVMIVTLGFFVFVVHMSMIFVSEGSRQGGEIMEEINTQHG